MNTANLQIEGLLLALTSLCEALKRKNVLTSDEIAEALDRAEQGTSVRAPKLSDANAEAIRFPIRFLREALGCDGRPLDYATIAAEIGRKRDDAAS